MTDNNSDSIGAQITLAAAERIGWRDFRDLGYGPQPIARYIGDGLGPLPKLPAQTKSEGSQ